MTLKLPKTLTADKKSYELVRLWASSGKLVSVLDLGRFAEMGVNEKMAWGTVLADFTKHMARGLSEKYGWDEDKTQSEIIAVMLKEIAKPTSGLSK